jgi:exosome complex component RRP4
MIVVPGTVVGRKKDKLEGTYYFFQDYAISPAVALKEVKGNRIKITPLSGIYLPNKGDLIIGRVIDVYPNGWQLDINSPYFGFMLVKDALTEFVDITKTDLNDYFTHGDFVVAKVINVTRNKLVNLTVKEKGLGKIKGGLIISINPKKVPRVIGKNASMINMIKQVSGASIIVGQNGRVWIKAKDPETELIVARAIHLIDLASHIRGLTDKVKKFLESKLQR